MFLIEFLCHSKLGLMMIESFVDHIRQVHQDVMVPVKASNEGYANEAYLHCLIKEFEKGELVLVHLR